MSKPILPISPDGIYEQCVYCKTEIYGPAVRDYSKGIAIPGCCNKPLPKEYIR